MRRAKVPSEKAVRPSPSAGTSSEADASPNAFNAKRRCVAFMVAAANVCTSSGTGRSSESDLPCAGGFASSAAGSSSKDCGGGGSFGAGAGWESAWAMPAVASNAATPRAGRIMHQAPCRRVYGSLEDERIRDRCRDAAGRRGQGPALHFGDDAGLDCLAVQSAGGDLDRRHLARRCDANLQQDASAELRVVHGAALEAGLHLAEMAMDHEASGLAIHRAGRGAG